jgi:hypothetical protein
MQLLCSSSSLAFVHSLRIALDGEGIQTYCSDADSRLSGIAGPMTGSAARLYVLNEDDWDLAVEVMESLAGPVEPRAEESQRRSPIPIWLIIGLSAMLIVVLVAMLENN